METIASGHAITTMSGGILLDAWFPAPTLSALSSAIPAELKALVGSDSVRGVSREIEVPMENVTAIYARENGQGMTFDTNLAERLASKKKNLGEDADASNQKAETVFTLAAVPKGDAQQSGEKANDDDQPDPPKPSGKPTLTRIK